jgi:hypothetical protein
MIVSLDILSARRRGLACVYLCLEFEFRRNGFFLFDPMNEEKVNESKEALGGGRFGA